MRHAVLCLLIKDTPIPRILLAHKKVGFGIGKIVGVGGGIEAGETPELAGIREVQEEIGVTVTQAHLEAAATITFLFPAKPSWNHYVHVFLARTWTGEAVESREVRPMWFKIAEIPYAKMWHDAAHWLPVILTGEQIEAKFTFCDDNETIADYSIRHISQKLGTGD